jgi:thiosulfate/3-mercaptopyruvate sulfurtransferase
LAEARTIAPLVSTNWLAKNLEEPKLVIVDIRTSDSYKAGHIPGAVNVPFRSWSVTRKGLLLELPEDKALFKIIGDAGIKGDSKVVVANKVDIHHDIADVTRTACTLMYAGVKNVAILDGGYNKWLKEKKPLSDKAVRPKPLAYKGELNKALFVTKEYVAKKLGKSAVIDSRAPDEFFGVTQDLFTDRPGHIPGASCLPAPWVWTEEGTYRSTREIREIATGVVGRDKSREIIVYCGVGGYSSTWCFLLRELLGYTDVKIYDGAAQEWTADPKAPMVRYSWN